MLVAICDVGPRDGLQNHPVRLEPATRARLVELLAATGIPVVEAASFVNPERVPQMAGAEEVVAAAGVDPSRLAALVLNRKGFDRAASAGVGHVHYAFAATDRFNRANANAPVAEGVATALEIVRLARARGMEVSVTIGAAFGCPFDGDVDPGRVLDLVAQVETAGPSEVVLADTIGVAVPGQVGRLVEAAARIVPRVGIHLHNTRGTGITNAWAALAAGARSLDSSVGGIGGCPFAPRATGNIATEDLVYLLEREGVSTGIDLERLIDVACWLEQELGGSTLPGLVYRAGLFPPRL